MNLRIVGAILIGVWSCGSFGQAPPPDLEPVQAEFLANLSTRHLESGKSVFARVTQDWKGPDCVLRKGAVLEGTVEESVPRVGKNESKLALSFKQAQCNGREMQPMSLFLTVIARAPASNSNLNVTMGFPSPQTMGPQFTASTLDYSLVKIQQTKIELSGVDHRFPAHKNIRPGDVLDMKGISLALGAGPYRSSVIQSKAGDVFLPEYTQILLAPPSLAFLPAAHLTVASLAKPYAGDLSARPAAVAAPPIPQPNNIEICAPPGCVVDLPISTQELQGHTAGSIATHGLGYTPSSNKALAGFADEESLAWLGPGQLLFAFNPHHLIRRNRADQGGTARMIRAVLLDTATRNVVRAVDWEITDARRYLWQLDGDHILVHVGNELRVYGPSLEVERTIALAGPLMFVRIAPSGSLMAVATLRERHSPELHAKLLTELDKEPEEDVDVALINNEFKTVAKVSTVSGLMAPTLLNEGQVRVQSEPGQWYRLAMSTWENKRSALARFHSFCTPQVTSTAPDLLFVLTCNATEGSTVYSVLRPDGKVLLRGISESQEIGHEATGNHRSRRFAVKIVHAERSILPSTTFRSSELDSEEVRVYRADDGKRLLAVSVREPVASHGGYALSPDGSQLAVLSGSDIEFFPVPE